jgi:hypothetical protein
MKNPIKIKLYLDIVLLYRRILVLIYMSYGILNNILHILLE